MTVEDSTQIENKSISQLCNIALSNNAQIIIQELNSMHGKAKEKITQLIHTLKDVDKLSDKEIKKVLLTEVHFVSRRTLYNALPEDMKREYTKKPEVQKSDIGHSQPEPVAPPVYKPEPEPTPPIQPVQQQQEPAKKKYDVHEKLSGYDIFTAFTNMKRDFPDYRDREGRRLKDIWGKKCTMHLVIEYL